MDVARYALSIGFFIYRLKTVYLFKKGLCHD